MGIKFKCEHCHRTLNVKDHLAGKRGICPKCQGKIEIPLASTEDGGEVAPEVAASADVRPAPAEAARPRSHATHDPIAEAPQLNWYVAPPGSMTKYGPAPGDLMRSWIREGRVSGDSLVWREGWPQWRVAAQAFPELTAAPAEAVLPTPKSAAPATPPPDVEDDVEFGFDGVVRAPLGVDIGVDAYEDDVAPPRSEPSANVSTAVEVESVDIEAIVQTSGVNAAFAAIAPIDEEPEQPRRAAGKTAAGYRGSKPDLNYAVIIAVLIVTFAVLLSVLIYLIFFRK